VSDEQAPLVRLIRDDQTIKYPIETIIKIYIFVRMLLLIYRQQ